MFILNKIENEVLYREVKNYREAYLYNSDPVLQREFQNYKVDEIKEYEVEDVSDYEKNNKKIVKRKDKGKKIGLDIIGEFIEAVMEIIADIVK